MKAYEVIRNNEATDFIRGARKFFSTYEGVVDYIFNHVDRKYYMRNTDIVETPEGLKNKVNESSWESVRSEDVPNPDSIFSVMGFTIEPEYFHVLEIQID